MTARSGPGGKLGVVRLLCLPALGLLGTSVIAGPVIATIAVIAGSVMIVLAIMPRVAMLLWIGSIFLLPFWFGAKVGFYLSPATAAGLLCLPSALLPAAAISRPGARADILSDLDVVILLFLSMCLLTGVFGLARPGDVANVLLQWALAFLVGRRLTRRVGIEFTFISVLAFSVVAGTGAAIEAISKFNVYQGLVVNNIYYGIWSPIQERGGELRVEWSFGHSIALGAALALSAPLVITSLLNTKIKTACLIVLGVAVNLTYSRASIGAFTVAVLLSIAFAGSFLTKGARLGVAALLAVGAAVFVPIVASVLDEAGSEAVGSASYRTDLLDLLSLMNPVGLARGATDTASGSATSASFGQFASIDSTPISIGVRFGYVPMGLFILIIVVLLVHLIQGRGSAAHLSVLGVLPVVLTAALITQYGMLFWFYTGVAAASMGGLRKPTEISRSRLSLRQSSVAPTGSDPSTFGGNFASTT